jgi:hypothetical protein
VLSVEQAASGIVPLRLPERAWQQVPDAITREVFRMSAGIRLSAVTDATVLEVDVVASRLTVAEVDFPTQPVQLDLSVDGHLQAQKRIDGLAERVFTIDGELLEEPESIVNTFRFDELPSGEKTIELWFPANACVELRAVRANAALQTLRDGRPRWIHYGSSISHCLEARSPTGTWPAVAARLADLDLLSLGVAGGCHLDPFVARAIRDARADSISMKIGINIAGGDTLKFRTFGPAVHGFLDTVREGHPDVPILVISPIICPSLEDAPGPAIAEDGVLTARGDEQTGSLSLRRMREILAEIVADRSVDDHNIHYLDGLSLFGPGDVDELPDALHPSPAGYEIIGRRFADIVLASPEYPRDPGDAAGRPQRLLLAGRRDPPRRFD